jgi:hypothetical protein
MNKALNDVVRLKKIKLQQELKINKQPSAKPIKIELTQ